MLFAHCIGYCKGYSLPHSIELNLYCAALSVEYVHQGGYKINLYCTKDSEWIGRLLPYDEVIVIEDESIADVVPEYVYSKYKMLGISNFKHNEIYIDTDVFITNRIAFKLLEDIGGDLAVQYRYSITDGDKVYTNSGLFRVMNLLCSLGILDSIPKEIGSVNGGVYKFNNDKYRKLVCEDYFKFYSDNPIFRCIDFSEAYVLDNYVEEYRIRNLIESDGGTVVGLDVDIMLSDANKRDPFVTQFEGDIGFEHLFGYSKSMTIRFRLKNMNQILYYKIKDVMLELTTNMINDLNNNIKLD